MEQVRTEQKSAKLIFAVVLIYFACINNWDMYYSVAPWYYQLFPYFSRTIAFTLCYSFALVFLCEWIDGTKFAGLWKKGAILFAFSLAFHVLCTFLFYQVYGGDLELAKQFQLTAVYFNLLFDVVVLCFLFFVLYRQKGKHALGSIPWICLAAAVGLCVCIVVLVQTFTPLPVNAAGDFESLDLPGALGGFENDLGRSLMNVALYLRLAAMISLFLFFILRAMAGNKQTRKSTQTEKYWIYGVMAIVLLFVLWISASTFALWGELYLVFVFWRELYIPIIIVVVFLTVPRLVISWSALKKGRSEKKHKMRSVWICLQDGDTDAWSFSKNGGIEVLGQDGDSDQQRYRYEAEGELVLVYRLADDQLEYKFERKGKLLLLDGQVYLEKE